MNYFLWIPILLAIAVFVFLNNRTFKEVYAKALLTFSGVFLLSLIVFELLPQIYTAGVSRDKPLFIMLGLLLQMFLEFFSGGVEHGHQHFKTHQKRTLYTLFITLSIHSILEGIPIIYDPKIFTVIMIHKLPIMLILANHFVICKIKPAKTLLFLVLFSAMTPLGTFLGRHVETVVLYQEYILCVMVGALFHVSTIILFESSKNHKFNIQKIILVALGIFVFYVFVG